MSVELAAAGAHVDAFYYCPHHPEGTVASYALLRMPQAGTRHDQEGVRRMAGGRLGSFLIGDRASDLEAARAADLTAYHFEGGSLEASSIASYARARDGGLPAANRGA